MYKTRASYTPARVVTTCTQLTALGLLITMPAPADAQDDVAAPQVSEIVCAGLSCTTYPAPLPNNYSESEIWDPCDGSGFTWAGEIDFEPNYDTLYINGDAFDGRSVTISGSEAGPVTVAATTDGNVTSDGIYVLDTECLWSDVLQCVDEACVTNIIPDSINQAQKLWSPCGGGPF